MSITTQLSMILNLILIQTQSTIELRSLPKAQARLQVKGFVVIQFQHHSTTELSSIRLPPRTVMGIESPRETGS